MSENETPSRSARLLFLALLACAAACGRPAHLAGGPIDLSAKPSTVRFAQPMPTNGRTWELCFEFERPGDSDRAEAIRATLVSRSGSREPLGSPALDRRGELTVCQIGRIAPPPGAIYEAVELSSGVPVRLRGIRGGGRP